MHTLIPFRVSARKSESSGEIRQHRAIKNPVGVGETYGVRREENRYDFITLI